MGQPSTPPAAEGRAALNLAVKLRGLGTGNYIEDTGCLVKSPRLKPGLSDTFSVASEIHAKAGAKFWVSGRENNGTMLFFKYYVFLICLLGEVVWSYCWAVNQTCNVFYLILCLTTYCMMYLSSVFSGLVKLWWRRYFLQIYIISLVQYFPNALFSECDKTFNKEVVLMVLLTNLVRCQVFSLRFLAVTKVTNSQCQVDSVCWFPMLSWSLFLLRHQK